MKANIVSLFCGVLFAIGLTISGMIDPAKVRGFLDIFGNWDISLLFVMGGAVGLNFFTFKWAQKRKPFLTGEHSLPTKTIIDRKLILGSALFGIGWGLVGICPGPGIVNLVRLDPEIFIFIISMIFGMLLHDKTKLGVK